LLFSVGFLFAAFGIHGGPTSKTEHCSLVPGRGIEGRDSGTKRGSTWAGERIKTQIEVDGPKSASKIARILTGNPLGARCSKLRRSPPFAVAVCRPKARRRCPAPVSCSLCCRRRRRRRPLENLSSLATAWSPG
jgi:hypothetical protein